MPTKYHQTQKFRLFISKFLKHEQKQQYLNAHRQFSKHEITVEYQQEEEKALSKLTFCVKGNREKVLIQVNGK